MRDVNTSFVHDDVNAWKFFLHHRPFVRGIHLSPPYSPNKGPVLRILDISSTKQRNSRDLKTYYVHVYLISSPRSAAYMRRWTGSTLVQIIACPLIGAKPLSEPIRNNFQWTLTRNSHNFIRENALENVVCKMAALFPRRSWVIHVFVYRTRSWSSLCLQTS